jgi:hypothetical protein
MNWLRWNPDRGGVLRLLLLLAIVVGVFAVIMTYVPDIQQRGANAGFGPDWDCTVQPKGGPTCIKKPGG